MCIVSIRGMDWTQNEKGAAELWKITKFGEKFGENEEQPGWTCVITRNFKEHKFRTGK